MPISLSTLSWKPAALLLVAVSFNLLFAQSRTITVRVLDAHTQKPIKGANVSIQDSSQGIVTNYLGYFQQTIAANQLAMTISHIGYQRSVADIPSVDKFTVLLTPAETTIDRLDLDDLVDYEKRKINTSLLDTSQNEIHATFSEGWPSFYSRLKKIIKSSPGYSSADFEVDVRFTISAEGALTNILLTPDSAKGNQTIRQALTTLSNFRPASQNKRNVPESFLLNVSSPEKQFERVENQPEYPGGYAALMDFIRQNLRYPVSARRKGIDGTVYVSFVINRDGSLTDIEIIRGIQADCDAEVVQLVKKMPKWIPGSLHGIPVNVRFNLPIKFKLN